jgi:hypothetical protein
MKVNFEIINNNALSFEGRHIDLHNNFDFVGFEYNIAEKEINLNWKKAIGDWIDKNEFSNLVLKHKSVTFLKVIDQDENSNYENDSCLGEITFFPSTAREINDSQIPQSKPKEGDDLLYFFENGQVIRIQSEEVKLEISSEHNLNLTLKKDESLVLFEFLTRFNETEHKDIFEDDAEQQILWTIEGQLEKQLVEPFLPNYKSLIEKARGNMRKEE